MGLAFSLAMIIVGTQNESTCQNEAAQYLTATGSFYLVAGFVYCMSTYLWSEGLVRFFDFVIACIWIVILLWGSITVFSKYFAQKTSYLLSPDLFRRISGLE